LSSSDIFLGGLVFVLVDGRAVFTIQVLGAESAR